jgi:hypothetical protein
MEVAPAQATMIAIRAPAEVMTTTISLHLLSVVCVVAEKFVSTTTRPPAKMEVAPAQAGMIVI